MDFDKLFPGRFLKAGEFNGQDVTYTIAGVVLEELEGETKREVKGLVSFRETPKQWVLNKTNGLCLKAMWGRETNEWIGRRVTLYPAQIQFEDADICIRVRGSPDITADVSFELKLPRKKARQVVLKKTGGGNGKAAVTAIDHRTHLGFNLAATEKGSLISTLSGADVAEAIELAKGKLASAPKGAPWMAALKANLGALEAEQARRLSAVTSDASDIPEVPQ